MLKYCLAFLLAPYFFLTARADSCLVISEVMFFPQGSNNEFVELYNLSETQSINLDSLRIKYSTSNPDIIIPANSGAILPPKSYAVILEGDYDFEGGIYKSLIPANALILRIADNSFGSNGMSNTAGRPVYLLNRTGDTLDAYTYSADNTAGYSDEKIILNKDSTKSNWTNSSVLNGTPGYKNSATPLNYNLCVEKIIASPSLLFEGGSVNISVLVKNKGIKQSGYFTVKIFNDANLDSVTAPGEMIAEKDFAPLNINDSVIISTSLSALAAGTYNIIAIITYPDDEYPADNILICSFTVYPKGSLYNDIVVNEIMYAPLSGQPEWIELYNRTDKKVNLKKWEICDKVSHVPVTLKDVFINPHSMVVITKDSSILNQFSIPVEIIKTSIPSLNNDGDAVVLKDSLSITIDSLEYAPAWGGSGGWSLERIDPDVSSIVQSNWGTSTNKNKASPGIKNSITPKDVDLQIKSFHPEKLTAEINSPVNIFLTIKNNGKLSSGNYNVKIYFDKNNDSTAGSGEIIKEFLQSSLAPRDSIVLSFPFSASTEGVNSLIAVIESANDEDTLNNTGHTAITAYKINVFRNELLINEIMYAPKAPRPEWIEIYNNCKKTINIKGFRLADENDTVIIISNSINIRPGEYFVISADSSITTYYPDEFNYTITSFPQLNNSGDKVILLDSLNRAIDSLQYTTDWNLSTSGASIERIETDLPSTDRDNWSSSKSILQGTPGKKNSISKKNFDIELIRLTAKHNICNITATNELTAAIKNSGKLPLQNIAVHFYADINNDSIPSADELLNRFSFQYLSPGDSVVIKLPVNSASPGFMHYFASAIYNGDEDPLNNTKYTSVNWYKNSEQRNDLVITEIMYAPVNQPEWIEIYNHSGKTVNLKNYKFADDADTIEITSKETLLEAGSYLVIVSDSTFFNTYNFTGQIIIKKLPGLNNAGDKAIILDKYDFVIDSVKYKPAWGGSDGKSLEKVDYNLPSNDSTNWKPSRNPQGGTPGNRNSVCPPETDICIRAVTSTPEYPIAGDDVSLSIKVINSGTMKAAFDLFVYSDSLKRFLLYNQNNISLAGKDSTSITINGLYKNIHSDKSIFVLVACKGDENLTDNYYYRNLRVIYKAGTLRVNEIMYNPSEYEPEWIELVNTSADTININDYSVNDLLSAPSFYKFNSDLLILPYSFFILSRDSTIFNCHAVIPAPVKTGSLPALNNDVDGVVLTDFRGVVQDSVLYNNKFGGKAGYSIERLSIEAPSGEPANWGSSVDNEKSTPGRKNSLAEKMYDLKVSNIFITPSNPAVGSSIQSGVVVRNTGKLNITEFEVSYYYCGDTAKGNLILFDKTKFTGLLKASDSCVIASHSLLNNISEKFLIKAQIIFEADEDTVNNTISKTFNSHHKANTVLINEIMYDPKADMPEWVEVVNVSGGPVNLCGWSLSDYNSTPVKGKISDHDLYIPAGEYFIIARDSSFFKYFPSLKSKTAIAPFGQLNNSEDGVILYDYNDSVICNVHYKNSWGGLNGFSLERISLNNLINDSTNWKTSLDITGCTPGAANSVCTVRQYRKNDLIINEIMSDPGSDNCEYFELLGMASDTINIGGWEAVINGKNIFKLSDFYHPLLKNEFYIVAADSNIIRKYPYLSSSKNLRIINTTSLGLTNSGGRITIKDLFGNIIDSANYPENKAGKNKSLEKISSSADPNLPASWNSCSDATGGTPGKTNSILSINSYNNSSIDISPNPFSPDDDGFEDVTQINYKLKQQVNSIRVRIYDSRGRLLRTLVNNQVTGNSGSIVFNGLDDSGNALRIGIYIILFEAMNNINVTETLKAVVVVARKF